MKFGLKQIRAATQIYRERGSAGIAKVALQKLANQNNGSSGPVVEFWTEYMNWLKFANSGMLSRGNTYCFNYAIQNLPSQSPILEIGSFCGLSANMITYFKEKYGAKNPLFTCDKWSFEGAQVEGMLGDSKTIRHDEYRTFVRESYIRNVKMFSRYDLPYTIEMFSDDFFNAWSRRDEVTDVFDRKVSLGGAISFCYIDGNHSYDFAKRDFENTDKFLEPGGFLLFDDSADGSGWEVCKVVKEVILTGRYNLVANNPNYFFKKKTSPTNLTQAM